MASLTMSRTVAYAASPMAARSLPKAVAANTSFGRAAFAPTRVAAKRTAGMSIRAMANITPNVSFDTVAREWRCKWDPADDKASLVAAQEVLDGVLSDLKAIPGVKNVQRVVCGGCQDFKIVTALDGDSFGDWEGKGFAPEEEVIKKLEGINGIQLVQTQTYTLMEM